MIGRVREMLRFQAKAITLFIDVPVLPGNRSVQKVARVKLHSRLGGQDLEHPSAGGFVHQGGGLLVGGLGWSYAQQGPDVPYAADQLGEPFGFKFSLNAFQANARQPIPLLIP